MDRLQGDKRDELTDFVEPSAPRKVDPAQYVLHWRWYYPSLVGGATLLFAVLYAMAGGVAGILALALVGTLAGLVLTMIAMAWGVAIAFADDTRRGLWFVIFPPYMAVYAVRRWQWMAQPAVMFLCGLGLAAAALWMTQRLTEKLGEPHRYGDRGYIHDAYARFPFEVSPVAPESTTPP